MLSPKSLLSVAALVCSALVMSTARADDPNSGASLYASHCAGCHGPSPLTSNVSKIYNGRNARAAIDASITSVGAMNSLRSTFPAGGTGLADLAAYLGNTPTSLSFPSTAVGSTSSALTVTVYASLKSGHAISGMTFATSGDFARSGGTCGTSVATGTSCTVGIVFSPTGAGSRAGTLSIAHGNTLAPITIALSGTASGGAAPAPTVAPAALSFGSTPIGSASAAQNVTLTNVGSEALSLSSVSWSSADFESAGGTCAFPGSVAPGSNCVLAVAFRPGAGAPGARSATVSIAHGASANPVTVSLSGTAASAGAPVASMTASLSFGTVTVGSTGSAQSATLSNTGSAPLTISSIATGSAEFGVSGGTCAVASSVAAGSSCTVGVAFAPTATGPRSATLLVGHDAAGGSSSTTLSGTGVAQSPAANVAPASLTFSQTVGTTSAAQTVTVANTGTAALTLGAITTGGSQASEFQLAGGGTCTAGASVAPNSSCTLHVTFTPTTAGARSAALSIAHDAPGSPSSVALGGTGTSSPQPTIALDATSVTFNAQPLGSTSAARNVTVTNSGAAALTLGSMTITGAAAADFARGGSCASGATLAPGATCVMALTFAPGAIGSRTATLNIASDATNGSAVLSLSGTGADAASAAVGVAPAALDFGNQTIGQRSAARSVVLTNTGSGALSIASIDAPAPFGVASDCGSSLPAGASCTLAITFTPTGAGPASGSVSIASNAAGSPHAVTVNGAGVVSAPTLAWTPVVTTLDFGSAGVGGTAPTRMQTLRNQGPGPTTLQQITMAGAQAGEFTVGAGSTCAANLELAQDATCSLEIAFHPAAAGARAATLHVTSSGTNPPDVALTGTGSASSQAQLDISPTALAFTAAGAKQELVLQNNGSAALSVTAVRVASGDFTLEAPASQACAAAPFDLLPGQSCRVAVAWAGTAAGEAGAIEIDSSAAVGTSSVALTTGLEAAPVTVISNVGHGGCSIAGPVGDGIDPTHALLVALACIALWRRRSTNPSLDQGRKTR